MTRNFPEGFMWGVGTASYQVEGAVAEDGRTASIWDTFTHVPGNITNGDTGDVACDEYHRYRTDAALARELGVGVFRFSVAWPRIIPALGGPVNRAGLDYYERLVDALLEAGLSPMVTLFHWDLPQYLQDSGGWVNRDTAHRFGDYAAVVAQALGDRVNLWTTLNEPWCPAFLGYASGDHAPGLRDPAAALTAAHHLNLAHGFGAQAIRSVLPDLNLSVALNVHALSAATDSAEDALALARVDRVGNDIWLSPMLGGRYDPQLFADTASITNWSFVRDGDLAQIHQPLDALGLNYYFPSQVRHVDQPPSAQVTGPFLNAGDWEFLPPKPPLTSMGWPQVPAGLTDLLIGMAHRFPGLDLIVTENGASFDDVVSPDGLVHDPQRVAYLDAHINAVADAIEAGVPVKGYILWSLLDNFEWAFGYSRRFGLLRTDYDTQDRIWKDSASWYQDVASHNRLT